MSSKHHANDQGLTLIEIILAVGVLAVGFVMLLGSIPSIHGTIEMNSDTAQALYHGASIVEEIQALPNSQLESYIPPVMNDLGANEVITVILLDNLGNEVVLPANLGAVPGGVPDPAEIQVYIQWTDDHGRRRITTVSSKKAVI
jgi:hypothetical protein